MFPSHDPEEAAKEIIRRFIGVEGAKIPLTEKGLLSLNIDSLDKQGLRGVIDLLGGELQFGVGRDKEGKGAGFTFRKQFADGGRTGYFMGSANPRGLGLLRQLLNFFGKKSDVIKNPSDVLRVINPKAFNKMLEDAKGKVMPKEGIMATDAIKDYQTQMAKDRVEMVKI